MYVNNELILKSFNFYFYFLTQIKGDLYCKGKRIQSPAANGIGKSENKKTSNKKTRIQSKARDGKARCEPCHTSAWCLR